MCRLRRLCDPNHAACPDCTCLYCCRCCCCRVSQMDLMNMMGGDGRVQQRIYSGGDNPVSVGRATWVIWKGLQCMDIRWGLD